jgi:hypothetical protein
MIQSHPVAKRQASSIPANGIRLEYESFGAEMRIIEGMGDDFPVALSGVFADAICATASRAA